ncbi:MAG: hypothetical protein HYS81_03950 [Candidatus Aenigmatarchaeota archaeon]|nr:MAG: hypothetical protein HYS81_03950 [Candidatus Aenigmarchaeota archaeon]
MPGQGTAFHHLHKRIRVHKKLEKYPHPDRLTNAMDKLIYVVSIIMPLLTVPQVLTVWLDGNVSGLSLVTWVSYLVASVFWLAYGILHREKPIIISNVLWIVVFAFIVVGIMMR